MGGAGYLSMYLNEEDPTQGTLKRYLGRAKRGLESVGHSVKERISDFYHNFNERYPLAYRFVPYHLAFVVVLPIGTCMSIMAGTAAGGPVDYSLAYDGLVMSEVLNASVFGLELAGDHFGNR